MRRFFETHNCNRVCRALGLRRHASQPPVEEDIHDDVQVGAADEVIPPDACQWKFCGKSVGSSHDPNQLREGNDVQLQYSSSVFI